VLCGAKISSASSVGRVPLFFGGRASEVLRKLRKDVLPEERAPMMRMLIRGQVGCIFDENYQLDLLEWSWVLPSSDPPRAVDCADCAAGIAVTSTMRHALSSSVWVHPVAIATSI
jgi:hypothetical protein